MIELNKKSKGVSNWFSEEWLTNGHFAVRRDLIGNSDEHLMALGFEERDGEELEGRLKFIPESFDTLAIFDSGFKWRGLTLFVGKNKEMIAFETKYLDSLRVARAEYSEQNAVAKVYENGDVSMILKPYLIQGTEVEKHFPEYRMLPQIKKQA